MLTFFAVRLRCAAVKGVWLLFGCSVCVQPSGVDGGAVRGVERRPFV
jgi:hypothetical protein